LEHPFFYDFIQHVTLAYKFRNRLIKEELKNNKFYKILDIGCATANILNVLGNNIIVDLKRKIPKWVYFNLKK